MKPADVDRVLALNNAYAAEVNDVTHDALAHALSVSTTAFLCLDPAGALAGFLIAYDQATPPQGPNHAWFLEQERAFVYVDRVVVAPFARGRGVARWMYASLERDAGGRAICCEVNVEPPNPGSLAFHERLGFEPCGEQLDPRNGKRVRFLRKSVYTRHRIEEMERLRALLEAEIRAALQPHWALRESGLRSWTVLVPPLDSGVERTFEISFEGERIVVTHDNDDGGPIAQHHFIRRACVLPMSLLTLPEGRRLEPTVRACLATIFEREKPNRWGLS